MRTAAILSLLMALLASSAIAVSDGAPGCCAAELALLAHASPPCGDGDSGAPLLPCCQMAPAEAPPGHPAPPAEVRTAWLGLAFDSAAVAAAAGFCAPARCSIVLSLRREPDGTVVLRL